MTEREPIDAADAFEALVRVLVGPAGYDTRLTPDERYALQVHGAALARSHIAYIRTLRA